MILKMIFKMQQLVNTIKQHVTAEKAVVFLAANGLQVTTEQASAVVNYLYGLANQTLNNEKSNSLHPGEHR